MTVSLAHAGRVLSTSTFVTVDLSWLQSAEGDFVDAHVVGWDGHADADEIFVTWTQQCHCDRPCCSGSFTTGATVGFDRIMEAFTGTPDEPVRFFVAEGFDDLIQGRCEAAAEQAHWNAMMP